MPHSPKTREAAIASRKPLRQPTEQRTPRSAAFMTVRRHFTGIVMKKLLLAGSVLAGFAAAPAMAADTVKPFVAPAPVAVLPATLGPQAWVDVAGGTLTETGSSGTITVAHVSGAANVPIGGGPFNVEFEGNAGLLSASGETVPLDYGMVHVFWRNHAFALGGFGGVEALGIVGSGARIDTFGAEAQAYHNKVSFYGQVAGFNVVESGPSENGWWARGGIQFFLTDNFMLEGDVRDISVGGENAWLYAATAEFRPMMWNASFFGTYRSLPESGTSINTWLAGVRLHIGNKTLHQQYTTGASMNVFPLIFQY